MKVIFDDSEFRKSTFSPPATTRCVEVAMRGDTIGVRDSNDPSKQTLIFTREEWEAFIGGVKTGEFDL